MFKSLLCVLTNSEQNDIKKIFFNILLYLLNFMSINHYLSDINNVFKSSQYVKVSISKNFLYVCATYIIRQAAIFNFVWCLPYHPTLAGMLVISRKTVPDFRKFKFPQAFLNSIHVTLFQLRIAAVSKAKRKPLK